MYLYITIFVVFSIFNTIEFISNYIFFFTELNLTELEYYYYNDLRYSNVNSEANVLEYDWYINYNIFPAYFNTVQNSLLNFYFLCLFIILLPYACYEVYLFVSPACYQHEKYKLKTIIMYIIISMIIYIYTIDKNVYNIFFYWTEDPYIYIFNEWTDIFINVTSVSKLYKFDFLISILYILIPIYHNFITNNYTTITVHDFRILNIKLIFLFIFFINLFVIDIEFIFLCKYILFLIIYCEQYALYNCIKITRSLQIKYENN